MGSKWKPYPQYQAKTLLTAESLPEHWNVKRLKFSATLNAGQSPSSSDVVEFKDGLFPFLQGNAEFGIAHPNPLNACSNPPKIANSGDILLSVRAPVGAMNNADQSYGIGRGLCAIKFDEEFDEAYGFYLLSHIKKSLKMFESGSTYKAVTRENIGELVCAQPPLDEQTLIGKFSEIVESKISSMIKDFSAIMPLLYQKRSALITKTVTEGLDPNAKMIDSEVLFFPQMPETWRIGKMKHIVDETRPISYGIVQCGPDLGRGVPYVRPVDMTDEGGVNIDEIQYTSEEIAAPYARSIIKSGDLVVSIGPSFGKVMTVPKELDGGNLTQGTARVAVDTSHHRGFFFWVMRSSPMAQQWESVAYGATFKALNLEPLWNSYVPIPPIDEQIKISNFLEKETDRIDQVISSIRISVQRLKEYRTALISAAVTGQIDVRDYPLPEGTP